MQSGTCDPTTKRLIQRGHPEGDPLHRQQLARQPRQSEALPQGSQGAGGGIGHEGICSLFVL